jgi:hypothetical protein
MHIRLISSLGPEDEARFAAVLAGVLRRLLEPLPIVYAMRVDTAAGDVVEHLRATVNGAPGLPGRGDSPSGRAAAPPRPR